NIMTFWRHSLLISRGRYLTLQTRDVMHHLCLFSNFVTSALIFIAWKVLVDVSNNLKKNMYPEANAEFLQRLIPGAHVVKAFNTLSAWALQNGPSDANRQVYLCGNSPEAKQAVAEIATKLGFNVQDRGSLSAARELEDFPLQLFPEWRLPMRLTIGLTAFFFFYLLVRDVIFAYVNQGKDNSFRIMENKTSVFDTTMGWRTDSYYSMGILGFGLYLLLGIASLPSVSNALSWREFSFIQVETDMFILFI
ncbi:hypothetical protein XENOCAPTIV_018944, partial [Xenoophorus captivus]